MIENQKIILATQSRQRRDLFATLQLPFKVEPSDIDELAINHLNHAVRARLVAEAKAAVAAQKYSQAIIIAADTFLVLKQKRLEKPATFREGSQMLQELSGQTCLCFTGWTYQDQIQRTQKSETTVSEISFRELSLKEIDDYVTTQPVTNWAGSFSLSTMAGIALIKSIQGSLNGVMGLPLEELVPLLKTSDVL